MSEVIRCRTCFQQITTEFYTLTDKLTHPHCPSIEKALAFCIPEMNLTAFEKTLICPTCFTDLCAAYTFKTKCMNIEAMLKEFSITKGSNIFTWGDFEVLEPDEQVQNDTQIKDEASDDNEHNSVHNDETTKEALHETVVEANKIEHDDTSSEELDFETRFLLTATPLYPGPTMKKVKPAAKLFICEICGYTTKNYKNFHRHRQAHHITKQFKCPHCTYKAKSTGILRIHVRTHTGEKPFVCDRCGYSTSSSGTLQRHIQAHTGKRLHKCNLCDYTATYRGQLTVHMRTHTGERPFPCGSCDYRATSQRQLNKHFETHTRKK